MISKSGYRSIGLFILGVMILYIGLGWNTSVAQKMNKEDKRLKDLIVWGQEIIDTPLKVVVKWQGEWRNEGKTSSFESAQQLVEHLGLSNLQLVSNTDHITYRSLTSVDGIRVTLNWQDMSRDASYIIVTMESIGSAQHAALLSLQNKYRAQMDLMKIDATWNASVQGNVMGTKSIDQSMNEVETQLQSSLKITQVESYEDEMTISHSYEAPSLGFGLISGDHHLDMQTAVHYDEVSGMNRVTIGLPIITVEY